MGFIPDDIVKFAKDKDLISSYGWHAQFSRKDVRSSPPKPPRIKTIAEITPMAIRYLYRIYFPNKLAKTMPFMDPLNPIKMESIYGVPIGGIGCGTIGRGFRGEFCRSSLCPGIYHHKVNYSDQFIVTVFRDGQVYQKVLSPQTNNSNIPYGLLSWEWGFPANHGHYVGLYPRSWTIYEIPEVDLVLICEQISPVIPHNYKDSCLPLGVFHWTVLNFHPTLEAQVSITMTWRGPSQRSQPPPPQTERFNAGAACCDPRILNSIVTSSNEDVTHTFESGMLRGCLMETRIGYQIPCCFGIAAAASKGIRVTRCSGFQFRTASPVPGAKTASRVCSHYLESTDDSNVYSPVPSQWSEESSTTSDSTTTEKTHLPGKGLFKSYIFASLASEFWKDLKASGALSDENISYIRNGDKKRSSKLVMAVCASCVVPPACTQLPGSSHTTPSGTPRMGSFSNSADVMGAGSATLQFFVTWHSPRIHFRSSIVPYRRRYVRWFSEDILDGATELLIYAADHWRSWRKSIIEWQEPILADPHLPDWYKSALFNELYFVSDGGTVWLDPLTTVKNNEAPIDYVRRYNPNVELDPLNITGRGGPLKSDSPTCRKSAIRGDNSKCNSKTPMTPLQNRIAFGQEMGLFAYLEGHEYRMFNTYDVHFNASWALIQLWPKIEMAMLYDLADMTASEDTTSVVFMYKGMKRQRNARLNVPHDLGDPEDEPWVNINAYIMYPTDDWKDLSPKFLLMAWRDWKLTGDTAFLQYVLPICLTVAKSYLEKWDSDGDGIIENSSFPDQTYDMWKAKGLSAYVGGLWVAALYAVADMLSHAGDFKSRMGSISSWTPVADNFVSLLKRAKDAYQKRLWDGKFYRYDSTIKSNSRSISVMSDQLSGYWFLRIGGAPIDAIIPAESANETLKTIVELNWLSVQNGHIGAINSVLSNGKIDSNNMQAEEFWVAVNYGIGALLILHGMRPEGFQLAGTCFDHVYNKMGLHFQTPEAYTKDGTYRSLGYMRPLAIWSIQRAVEMASTPSHPHPASHPPLAPSPLPIRK